MLQYDYYSFKDGLHLSNENEIKLRGPHLLSELWRRPKKLGVLAYYRNVN
jgi:hypothetical protein